MIDTTKLKDEWGYSINEPYKPISMPNPYSGKTSITKKPDGTTTQTTEGTMENIQYPGQWGQANDVWSQMAKGTYSNAGMDWLKNLLSSGGSQKAVTDWGAAQKPAMMDEYSNMVKQMAEQAGMGGARYGSGLQNSISNYGGQLQNSFQAALMDRMLQGQGQDVNTASNLGQFGLNAAQAGGQGLMGLGSLYSQLPLSVASTISGIGNAGEANQQNWAQLLNQALLGTQNTQQTYNSSGLTNILGILGSMPWGQIFGGGSGASVYNGD